MIIIPPAVFFAGMTSNTLKKKNSPGDGHCFYHSLVRGLRDSGINTELVNEIVGALVGDDQKIDGNIPKISENRYPVVILRKALQNSGIYDDTNDERLTYGLERAIYGQSVDEKGWGTDVDIEAAAQWFSICIAVWVPRIQSSIGNAPAHWEVFPKSQGRCRDLSNKYECPVVIFMENPRGGHFNILEPVYEPWSCRGCSKGTEPFFESKKPPNFCRKCGEKDPLWTIWDHLCKNCRFDQRILMVPPNFCPRCRDPNGEYYCGECGNDYSATYPLKNIKNRTKT